MSPTEFMRRCHLARTYRTTSHPPLGGFLALYEQLGRECDPLVPIRVSGDSTGTSRTAQLAVD